MGISYVLKKLKRFVAKSLKTKTVKKSILKALREQVWLKVYGETFTNKCMITWCTNNINPFDFHVGHNIPEGHGGSNNIDNLFPICSRCNLSMSNRHTIDEWNNGYT